MIDFAVILAHDRVADRAATAATPRNPVRRAAGRARVRICPSGAASGDVLLKAA